MLKAETPVVDIAVLYPSTAILLDPHVLGLLKDRSASLRQHLDFDLVDETMLKDGALERYGTLISVVDSYVPEEAENAISAWVMQNGGLYIHAVGEVAEEHVTERGSGYVLQIRSSGDLTSAISSAVINSGGKYPWQGRDVIADRPAGVFAATCADGTYVYNASNKDCVLALNGGQLSLPSHSVSKSEGPHAVCKS
jgi:hypothetical protein